MFANDFTGPMHMYIHVFHQSAYLNDLNYWKGWGHVKCGRTWYNHLDSGCCISIQPSGIWLYTFSSSCTLLTLGGAWFDLCTQLGAFLFSWEFKPEKWSMHSKVWGLIFPVQCFFLVGTFGCTFGGLFLPFYYPCENFWLSMFVRRFLYNDHYI